MHLDLFTNETADGSYGSQKILPGEWIMAVEGTFDGATVTLEYSIEGTTTWNTIDADLAVTDSTPVLFTFMNAYVRATISGAGGSTNLTCVVRRAERWDNQDNG